MPVRYGAEDPAFEMMGVVPAMTAPDSPYIDLPTSLHEPFLTVRARHDIDYPAPGTNLDELRVRVPLARHDKPHASEMYDELDLATAMERATAHNLAMIRRVQDWYPVTGFAREVRQPLYLVDGPADEATDEAHWSFSPHGQEGPASNVNEQILEYVVEALGGSFQDTAEKEVIIHVSSNGGRMRRVVRNYAVARIDGPVRPPTKAETERRMTDDDVPEEIRSWNIVIAETEMQSRADETQPYESDHIATEAWLVDPYTEMSKTYIPSDKSETRELADDGERQVRADMAAGLIHEGPLEIDMAIGATAVGAAATEADDSPLLPLDAVTRILDEAKDARLAERLRCGRRSGITVVRRAARQPAAESAVRLEPEPVGS